MPEIWLNPKLTIIVATTQGLKMHGGVALEDIKKLIRKVEEGFENLDKHIRNMQAFGQTVVVCFNRYATDVDSEIDLCRKHCEDMGVALP